MAKITILGAGGFGVSLAIAAYQNQHQVTVWDISEEIVQAILRDGEHKTKLPGVKIPKGIGFTTDPHCMENSDMVVFVVPSLFIRSVAQRVKPFLTKDTILVNALAAGICDGLHCGDNTKAALMTRGIHEITNLGVKMGGKPETFGGLSGIGDLIVTCCSIHSRNRRAGILIGEGTSPEDAVKQVGTVEGYYCCHAAWALAQKHGVSMPITEQLYHILFDGADPKQALDNLMSRPKKHEYEKF